MTNHEPSASWVNPLVLEAEAAHARADVWEAAVRAALKRIEDDADHAMYVGPVADDEAEQTLSAVGAILTAALEDGPVSDDAAREVGIRERCQSLVAAAEMALSDLAQASAQLTKDGDLTVFRHCQRATERLRRGLDAVMGHGA